RPGAALSAAKRKPGSKRGRRVAPGLPFFLPASRRSARDAKKEPIISLAYRLSSKRHHPTPERPPMGVTNMFARTDRLLLRPGWHEDAPALARAIGEEAIVRNLARAPWPYHEKDARAFLAGWTDGHPSRFLMLQRTASAPRLIGG